MDLFEYQAKELFAKHGVPVPLGRSSRHRRRGAGAAAEQLGGSVVVKAQVKTGGRGKAGGVKFAADPGRRRGEGRARSSAWTSRATPSTGCWSTEAQRHRGGVLRLLPARPRRTAPSSPWRPREGGMEIEELARRAPRGARAGSRSTRSTGVDAAKAARDRRRPASFPAEVAPTRSPTCCEQLWSVFVDEDATLVEVNPLVA